MSNVRGVIRGNTVEDNGFGPGFTFPANGIGISNNLNAETDTRVLVAYNQSNHNRNSGIFVSAEGNRVLHDSALNNVGFFFGADLNDSRFDCDANIWSDNTYMTALPECAAVAATRCRDPRYRRRRPRPGHRRSTGRCPADQGASRMSRWS